jgi:hypothetical protein
MRIEDPRLYLLLRFHERSALQTLDPTICWSRLIPDRGNGEICTLTTPAADYDLRLFAAVVARHLWERLMRGRWRCRKHPVLEKFSTSRSAGITRIGGSKLGFGHGRHLSNLRVGSFSTRRIAGQRCRHGNYAVSSVFAALADYSPADGVCYCRRIGIAK